MSKEALEQALEALEMYCEHGAILRPLEARDAIKEALAKQEQEEDFFKQIGNQSMMQLWQNYCDVKVERDELQEKLSKQEQGEPVALEKVYETIIHWDEGGGKRSRRELARRIETLYTTPQQRKPLTDEQIEAIAKEHIAVGTRSFEEFARRIEAAHGIKE